MDKELTELKIEISNTKYTFIEQNSGEVVQVEPIGLPFFVDQSNQQLDELIGIMAEQEGISGYNAFTKSKRIHPCERGRLRSVQLYKIV
jgi:hypothetical protein